MLISNSNEYRKDNEIPFMSEGCIGNGAGKLLELSAAVVELEPLRASNEHEQLFTFCLKL